MQKLIMKMSMSVDGFVGGPNGERFAQSLIRHGLIDEFRLLVHPAALGKGLPLFAALSRPLNLKLISATAFAAGTVAHIYQPA